MLTERREINDFKEFHRLVPVLIEKINSDEKLAIRALVNPLLAFEELGYELSRDVQKQVERVLRFRPGERKRLRELEQQINEQAGHALDPDSSEELETVLFNELKLSKPEGMKSLEQPDVAEKGAVLLQRKEFRWSDPLEPLKEKHPVVDSILAYRELQSSRPGFASRTQYEQLKSEEVKLPISRVRLRLPEGGIRHEEVEEDA